MKDVSKTLLKILFWLVLIILIITLISGALSAAGIDLGYLLSGNKSVEETPLQNGLKALTNGGLTPQEFEKQRQDENAPYSGDEVKNFYIRETDKYVIFYRQADLNGSTIYPNISFVKTDKGLIWDGAWGVKVKLHTNWLTGYHDFNNPTWELNLINNGFSYSNKSTWWKAFATLNIFGFATREENIVTFSDFNEAFCSDFYNCNGIANLLMNRRNEINRLQNITHEYLLKNILIPYFEMLDENIEFEMGNNDSETLSKLNACFTYLWNNSKTEDLTEKETIVDVSKYYGKIIPEEERTKYPIPEDKQEEYGNKKYYSAYYCKIYADCYYSYHSDVKVDRDNNKIKDYVKDYGVDEVPENQTKNYSQLIIKFKNKDNSDLIGLDLKESPVKFNINGITLIFDNLKDLENGKSIVVDSGSILAYTINSDGLVFDSYSGTLTANHSKVETYFKYSYMSGYVAVSITLQPLASFDYSNLDLTKNPYIMSFYSNDDLSASIQFVFDSNSKLNETITQYMKVGSYGLLVTGQDDIRVDFSSVSDGIIVTPENRKFVFTYYLENHSGKLVPDVFVSKMQNENGEYVKTTTPNDIRYSCSLNNIDLTSVKTRYPNVTENDVLKIRVKFYDLSGYVVGEMLDEHNITNESKCKKLESNFYENLKNDARYRCQLFVMAPDNSGYFVSEVFEFIYDSSYVYNVSFTIDLSFANGGE